MFMLLLLSVSITAGGMYAVYQVHVKKRLQVSSMLSSVEGGGIGEEVVLLNATYWSACVCVCVL